MNIKCDIYTDDEFDKAIKEIAPFTTEDTIDILGKAYETDSLFIPFEHVIYLTCWCNIHLNKYKKGTVDNMNTPNFILHTTSTFIKDGAEIEDAKDIISLIDYFNLTKEKYHFDILTLKGYHDCYDLYLDNISTEYADTLESMLYEYIRYLPDLDERAFAYCALGMFTDKNVKIRLTKRGGCNE